MLRRLLFAAIVVAGALAPSCGESAGGMTPMAASESGQQDAAGSTSPQPAGSASAEDPASARTRDPLGSYDLSKTLEQLFPPAPPGTLACEGTLNESFSMLADSTTTPAKYGAYWRGAFAPLEGVADDLVELNGSGASGAPIKGARLRLVPDGPAVLQKIVADERWSDLLVVQVAWDAPPGGELVVTLRDGPGRTSVQRVVATEATPTQLSLFDLGASFRKEHGVAPSPRLELELAAQGAEISLRWASARRM